MSFKKGDEIICLTTHGWTSGCVTLHKVYAIQSFANIVYPVQEKALIDQYYIIIGDNGLKYRTNAKGFELYSKYLSDIRQNKIQMILT
jgi:hypothetical protein